jgi:DNA-binding PadR family transcriptional regulator
METGVSQFGANPKGKRGIMGRENIEAALTMELRRGTIVLVCLCCLDEPVHGYGLVEQLAEKGIPVETNTLYPLLRRLSSQGLLEDRWDTSSSKPRKYYCITDEGRRVREVLIKQWKHMSDAMEGIMRDV